MIKPFYKCDAFNFVPFTRTPWAGQQISKLKQKSFPNEQNKIPLFIGESWEVSTDYQFPSKIEMDKNTFITLNDFLKFSSEEILGKEVFDKYGNHFPLLLKWLEANEKLSVQLHPSNLNPLLNDTECGKPEAWLVLNTEENGFVYLGFKENLSKDEIEQHLKKDECEKVLHKYYPKKYDYISVPAGCVHAVGPNVLVAEPQFILPKKSGKTWRISDWKRLYDTQGKQSPTGKPRELHLDDALSSIDWNLPRGKELEKLLIQSISSEKSFTGNKYNPFALKLYKQEGEFYYTALIENSFSLFTVWEGCVTLSTETDKIELHAGESGFICANTNKVNVSVKENGAIAFFGLSLTS